MMDIRECIGVFPDGLDAQARMILDELKTYDGEDTEHDNIHSDLAKLRVLLLAGNIARQAILDLDVGSSDSRGDNAAQPLLDALNGYLHTLPIEGSLRLDEDGSVVLTEEETQFCGACGESLECSLCGSESTDAKRCTECDEPTMRCPHCCPEDE